MEVKRLTKIEIIDETLEFYKTNPRATDSKDNCMYLDPKTGNKCAYGRCMIDARFLVNSGRTAQAVHRDTLLLERYRGHDECFWGDIQDIHDVYLDPETDENIFLDGIKRLKDKYS